VPEIATVSHRHEAIMNFMVANPTAKLGDVANQFGVTQPWLSCIIHSHAFKTKLREKQDEMWGDLAATVTEKLEAVAHATLDNILEHVHTCKMSLDANVEVADRVLHRLGFAPNRPTAPTLAPTQVNVFNVSRDDLEQARNLITGRAAAPALEDMRDTYSSRGGVGSVIEYAAPIPS
jgi:hypothetical protein